MLKQEIELLNSSNDLRDVDEILKKAKTRASQIHHLNLASKVSYHHRTCGSTHYIKYEVQDIFRVQRQGEFEKLARANTPALPATAVFCGTARVPHNFGDILSQDLRISPPKAPANGYPM
ncbi:hypothetical protein E4T42_07000 [Aureobasidium subglaciale]|nr:hypothetical protein E4T38_09519 [Aureobasidium subglaciale]KAI5213497.1 hypothetical protein E4T40_09671 [Aureobasidium subglaciale]KAI5215740.1 hypothetical protein E4T41_09472 [Aureobasidium subglaciale]KAI5244833.1 hypothetical protein E4T42_07000 [Aureobasidium subglaciale]KAI5253861.1 hypothetical protein E4T46_09427 [Aureobasidium subglaciale]